MAQDPPDPDAPDWIDRVVAAAAALGFNEVRTRWKLMAWAKSWESRKARGHQAVEHAMFVNKLCPFCGALNDRAEARCHRCDEELPSHRWQVLSRLGLVSPIGWTVSSLVALVAALAYLRVAWAGGLGQAAPDELVRRGAATGALLLAGEWWRLLTAPLLHASAAHLGFFLVAITQLGPQLERVFGRSRVLALTLGLGAGLTFVLVKLGPALLVCGGVATVLALGAFGVVWGGREGTRLGTTLREGLWRWVAGLGLGAYYFLPGAAGYFAGGAVHDGVFVGLLAGAALGAVVPPRWMPRREAPGVSRGARVIGLLLAAVSAALLVWPPASALAEAWIEVAITAWLEAQG